MPKERDTSITVWAYSGLQTSSELIGCWVRCCVTIIHLMKLLVEILNSRVASLIAVLNSMAQGRAKPLTDVKALLMEKLREADSVW